LEISLIQLMHNTEL